MKPAYCLIWIETNPGPHRRLVVGFHIAAELRTAICSKLGLDVCAWVATNKLLAKLVSGSFKPNQQTTLLPQDVDHIMGHLGGLHRVPGVGHQTSKWLQALGLVTVQDLQLFPLAGLVKEYGVPTGQRLKNLSLGVDDSPVVPTGAPKSLGDEDSFKKISTTREVAEKTQELLTSLVERERRPAAPDLQADHPEVLCREQVVQQGEPPVSRPPPPRTQGGLRQH